MAGTAAEMRIASNALILLGDEPISDYNGSGAGSIAASNLFNPTYDWLALSYPFNFMTKVVRLSRLSAKPITKYSYTYQLPADILKLIDCSSADYELMQDNLITSDSDVIVTYTARTQIDKAPEYFNQALEMLLAEKLAIPVTGDLQKASFYKQEAERYIKKARFIDSTQTPNKRIHSPMIEARLRG